MIEKEFSIKTPDKKIIRGILRGPINKPLVVIVHGLCGNMNEGLPFNAARFLQKKGFSSFRFNLYSWEKGSRKLHECTLATHGKDIDTIVKFLIKKSAKKLFAAGHSYGFPSILKSHTKNFKAIVSWDGSFLPHKHFANLKKIHNPKGRILDEGYLAIMGEEMLKESTKLQSLDLIKKLTIPVKFIPAADEVSGNLRGNKKMYQAAKTVKELSVIRGATHNFTEDGKQEQLYKATVSFFKRFI